LNGEKMKKGSSILLAVALFVAGAAFAKLSTQPTQARPFSGRVLKLEELSFTDIGKLDRAKTIFFLTFGNLEEHGPHLPVGADYFQAIGVRDGLIARLRVAHPDYDFVIMPVVPLGEGGANSVALQLDHVGTFAVRYETLRNVAMDLGATIARKGFRNIFLIHSHGAFLHNVAFSEAAAFVSEQYKARMVNITSLVFGEGLYSPKVMDKYLGEGWEKRIGFEGHAGAAETSAILFLRGDLVKPEYRRLQPFVAKDVAEFMRTYERTGWNGYWGDPAEASKAMGKDLINDFAERSFRVAEKALAGEDLSKLPVYPNVLPAVPEAEMIGRKVEEDYAKQAAAIEAWLKKQRAGKR
jgi:creatinine amidohydrolase